MMRSPFSVTYKRKGTKIENVLKKDTKIDYYTKLARYGALGVMALASATPSDTGKTSESWGFEIIEKENSVSIVWTNSNIPRGVPVAILIQYGHAMPDGRYVEGIDYINPALKPIFDEMAEEIWTEVTKE